MADMLDVVLSSFLILSIVFLVYELRKFSSLHAKKYEIPTEKIWEKFVGIRPEDMSESDLTMKVNDLEKQLKEIRHELEGQKKFTKKLIEELGK